MRCRGCGTLVDEAWRWCPDCGAALAGWALRVARGYTVEWAVDESAPVASGGELDQGKT
jgi:hypothetical protein